MEEAPTIGHFGKKRHSGEQAESWSTETEEGQVSKSYGL
jgi:hypothetical protein